MKIVKTVCNMCAVHCGLDAHVENGKIIKIGGMPEHLINTLCQKVHAIPELYTQVSDLLIH